jgi:hypothetical protein
MPVELPPEDCGERKPSPPNQVVWLVLLVVTMAGGCALTLTTWPTGEPTNTVRFWIDLFVKPFLIWAAALGLRTLYSEQECARIDAENAALSGDRRKAITFASEPLAVLGFAYLTGAGSSDISTLLRKADESDAATFDNETESGRYESLGLAGDDEDPTRYRACFKELIAEISDAIRAVPSDVPLTVRLHLPEMEGQSAVLKGWETIWVEAKLRPAHALLVAPERGLMELDEWLDRRGGLSLERCVLYVSIRLRDVPSGVGAEAASAIFLGWAPLVRRHGVRVIALVHRPVESDAEDIEPAMATAFMWGRTTVNAVKDIWQARVKGTERVAISKCVEKKSGSGKESAGQGEIRDVTAFLGDAAEGSGWLAIALAIENTQQEHCPQLVACRESTFRFAVVQPDIKTQTPAGAEA